MLHLHLVVQGGQARLPIVEFDNDNKPKNIALINFFGSLHNIGGTIDTVPRETSLDLIDYPPNRIAVINTLSTWSDNNLLIRIRHERYHLMEIMKNTILLMAHTFTILEL